jgi:hypothetical protein
MTTFIVRARPSAWGAKVDAHDGYAYGGGRDGTTGRGSAEQYASFAEATKAGVKLLSRLKADGRLVPYAEVVEVLDRVVGQVDLEERITDARAPDAEDRGPARKTRARKPR